MTVNRYSIFGDYADNYCEDYAPPGSNTLFSSGGNSFAPARMPGYPTYVMSWSQASQRSAGLANFGFAPYVQELLIKLAWSGMSSADRSSLEAYHAAMNGMATAFTLFNPVIGPALPVRFAADTLPTMPEVAAGRYRVELALRLANSFPAPQSSAAAQAITGNRFVCKGGAFAMPAPLRPTTGYSLQRPQTLDRDSSGSTVVYTTSRLQLRQHLYAMALDYDGFIRLQALFFSFAHGSRYPFQWIEPDGTTRTLRLAQPQISIRQTMFNRYETELSLVEES